MFEMNISKKKYMMFGAVWNLSKELFVIIKISIKNSLK